MVACQLMTEPPLSAALAARRFVSCSAATFSSSTKALGYLKTLSNRCKIVGLAASCLEGAG